MMLGTVVAWLLLILGASISLLNFHLSFIRPRYHRLRRRREEYHFVSGIPLIGQLLCLVSIPFFPTPSVPQLIAIIAALLDTAGIHWLILGLLGRGDRR